MLVFLQSVFIPREGGGGAGRFPLGHSLVGLSARHRHQEGGGINPREGEMKVTKHDGNGVRGKIRRAEGARIWMIMGGMIRLSSLSLWLSGGLLPYLLTRTQCTNKTQISHTHPFLCPFVDLPQLQ